MSDEKPKPFAVARETEFPRDKYLLLDGRRVMNTGQGFGTAPELVEALNRAVDAREAKLCGLIDDMIALVAAGEWIDVYPDADGDPHEELVADQLRRLVAERLAGTGPDYVPRAELDAALAQVEAARAAFDSLEPEAYKTHEHVARFLEQKGLRRVTPPKSRGYEQAIEDALAIFLEDWWPPTGPGGLCLSCGAWTPARHPETHNHRDNCAAYVEFVQRRDKHQRIRSLLREDEQAMDAEWRVRRPRCPHCSDLPYIAGSGHNVVCPECGEFREAATEAERSVARTMLGGRLNDD